MIHLTDELLNEYLDHELADRAPVENHLAACADCAARLAALKALFTELESLPELELTHSLAARFLPDPVPTPQLPRWLTLTACLQAALALTVIMAAAPFVTNLLPAIKTRSITEILNQLQSLWIAWLDFLSSFSLPAIPQFPPIEISSLVLSLILAGVSLLWLVGNGLFLKNQIK